MIAFSLGQNHTQELMRARLAAKVGADGVRQLMTPFPGQDREPVIVAPEAGGYGAERRAALEAAGPLLAAVLTEGAVGVGSNNWVVHGSRTAPGKPMLANDTQLELDMHSVWYENGLHAGRFDVTGFSFPGVPMGLIGHNARIPWGIPSMCGYAQALFVETAGGPGPRVVREPIRLKSG